MIADHFSVRIALLLCLFAPGGAFAQSFDCAKATTATERLICADQKLGALDLELAAELRKALAAAPAGRDELLAAERRWVNDRDKICAVPLGVLKGEARARGAACLADAYRGRIAPLRSAAGAAPAGRLDTEICRRVGDHYRALLDKDPEAPFKKSFYADSPLETLAAAGSGVTVAEPVEEIDEYSRRKAVAWANSLQPPVVLPEEVLKAFDDEIASSRLRIDRLPGTNFYAASALGGTANCYSNAYFEAVRGRAKLALGPAAWDDENEAGCGVTRAFGTVDKTPVAFEDGHAYTPELVSPLSISAWRDKGFGPACTLKFAFSPRFDAHGSFNAWSEHCEGADCDALRRAALALVEKAQAAPLAAQKAAVEALTPAQREQYSLSRKQTGQASQAETSTDPGDPDSYTENAPLLMPLVHENRLYLAGLGHFTIGWRVYSDWSVALTRFEKGKIEDRATFAIGMTKGRLERISIE